MSENIFHKDYHLVEEFGEWVAYRSKAFKVLGSHRNNRPEDDKTPADIDRIVLGVSDLEQAKANLDRKLKPKKKVKYNPHHFNQLKLEP